MTKQLLALVLNLLCLTNYGQCPTLQNVLFTTQTDIDAFPINYPNCIGGEDISFTISGASIYNLNALTQITSLNGLTINDCPNLSSLQGLHNLLSLTGTFSGSLSIKNCDLLQNLSGLNSLNNVRGVSIENNQNLQNLEGLYNLHSIEYAFRLSDNPSLNSLSDLSALSTFGNTEMDNVFIINSNPLLVSLTGLENVNFIDEINNQFIIQILNNQSLQFCSFPNICNLLGLQFIEVTIENNLSNCETEDDVLTNCQLSTNEHYPDLVAKVFPNPTKDLVQILNSSRIKSLRVYDVQGNELNLEFREEIINLETFSTGLYILRIEDDQKTSIHKIFKI